MSIPWPPALAVTRAGVTRMVRDRTALFFMVMLPAAIIIVIGATITDFDRFRVGVVAAPSGPLATQLTEQLADDPGLKTRQLDGESAARTALRRGELDAVVVIPATLDTDIRAGRDVVVPVLVEPRGSSGFAAVSSVAAVVADHAGRLQAARFAAVETGGPYDTMLAHAAAEEARTPPITVPTESAGGDSRILPLGFNYSTPTMLVLFVFLNSLAVGAVIVQNRRLGVYARALASPVGTRDLIIGEALAYIALAVFQSLVIVAIGGLLFGVSWGDPVGAAALVTVWALVGTGAGMLSGAVFRTPEQASAIGPALGIGLGMLGGCMWPLAVVPEWLRAVGHAVPHSWAVDGWTVLLSQHGEIDDIGGQLGVLAAFAAGLLALASVLLHRRITR